ncbi:MAG: hypothetical protein HUK17_08060, partial [Bacteroidales bacterium]|nr:hypothetical protein [Bacteroidales bacterium]
SDGVNVIVATDDSASVSLVSGNLYYFWVRTDCGSSSSDWHGPAVGSTMKTKNMLVTGSDTLYNACGWIIYDNGGPNGNYSDNCLSTLVLYPTEGYLLSISGSGYIENAQWDWLKIFDGTTTNGTPLWAWTSSMSTTFTVPTTNSETGALTLQFKSDGSSNFDGFELFVTCEPMPECPRPGTPVASHPTADGITLSWNENGTATSWFVVYDTVPITDFDSYNPVMVSSNPAIISGLDETTTYYFYVQADCGSNQSQWSNPVVATTGFACDGEYSYASIQQPSTSGNSSVLLNGGWGNSVTQTIYTAAELSQMGLFEGYIHNMSVECTSISTPYAKKQSLY